LLESGALHVLINCAEAGGVYASGLGKLLRVYRDLHVAGGEFGLFQLPASLQEIIEITRMDRLLKLYPDPEAAVLALWGDRPTGRLSSC